MLVHEQGEMLGECMISQSTEIKNKLHQKSVLFVEKLKYNTKKGVYNIKSKNMYISSNIEYITNLYLLND